MSIRDNPLPPKKKILNEFNENLDSLQREKSDYEKYQICLKGQINELLLKNEQLLSCLDSHRVYFETLVQNYKIIEKDYQDQLSGEVFKKRIKSKLEKMKKNQDPKHPIDVISSLINRTDKKYKNRKTELKAIQNQIAQIDIQKIMNAFDEKEILIKHHLELQKKANFLISQFDLPQNTQPKKTITLLYKLIKTMNQCDRRRKRLFALKYGGYIAEDISITDFESSSEEENENQLTVVELIEKFPDVRPSQNLQALIDQEINRRRRKEAKRRRREEIEKEDEAFIRKSKNLWMNRNYSNSIPVIPPSPKPSSERKHRKLQSNPAINQIQPQDEKQIKDSDQKNQNTNENHNIQPPIEPMAQSLPGRKIRKLNSTEQSKSIADNKSKESDTITEDKNNESKKNAFSSLSEVSYNNASSHSSSIKIDDKNELEENNNSERSQSLVANNEKDQSHQNTESNSNKNDLAVKEKVNSNYSNHENEKHLMTKVESDPPKQESKISNDEQLSNDHKESAESQSNDNEIDQNKISSDTKITKSKELSAPQPAVTDDLHQKNRASDEEQSGSKRRKSSEFQLNDNVSQNDDNGSHKSSHAQQSEHDSEKVEKENVTGNIAIQKKESTELQASEHDDGLHENKIALKPDEKKDHDKHSSEFQSDVQNQEKTVSEGNEKIACPVKESSKILSSEENRERKDNEIFEENVQGKETAFQPIDKDVDENDKEILQNVIDKNASLLLENVSPESQPSKIDDKAEIIKDYAAKTTNQKESDEFQPSNNDSEDKKEIVKKDSTKTAKEKESDEFQPSDNESEDKKEMVAKDSTQTAKEKESDEFQPSDNESEDKKEIVKDDATKTTKEKESDEFQLSENDSDKEISKTNIEKSMNEKEVSEVKSSNISDFGPISSENEKIVTKENDPAIQENGNNENGKEETILTKASDNKANVVEELSDIPDVELSSDGDTPQISSRKESVEINNLEDNTIDTVKGNNETQIKKQKELNEFQSDEDQQETVYSEDKNKPSLQEKDSSGMHDLDISGNKDAEKVNNEQETNTQNQDNDAAKKENENKSVIEKEVSEFKSSDIPELESLRSSIAKDLTNEKDNTSTKNQVENAAKVNHNDVEELSDIPDIEISSDNDKNIISSVKKADNQSNSHPANSPQTNVETNDFSEIKESDGDKTEISINHDEPSSNIPIEQDELQEISTENASKENVENDNHSKESESEKYLPRPPSTESDKKIKKRRYPNASEAEATEMNVTFDLSNETKPENKLSNDNENIFLMSPSSSYISEIKAVFTNSNESSKQKNQPDDQEENSSKNDNNLIPLQKNDNNIDNSIQSPHKIISEALNTIESLQSKPKDDDGTTNGEKNSTDEYDSEDQFIQIKLELSELYSIEAEGKNQNPRLSSLIQSLNALTNQSNNYNSKVNQTDENEESKTLKHSKSFQGLSSLPNLVEVESNQDITNIRIRDKNENLDSNLARIQNNIDSIDSEIEELRKKFIMASRKEVSTQSDIKYSMKSLKQMKDEINQNEDSERVLNELRLRKEKAEQDLKNLEEQFNQASKLSVRKRASLKRYKELNGGDSDDMASKMQSMTKEERKMYKIDQAIKRGKRTINFIDGRIADLKNIIDMKTKELSVKAKKQRPDVIGLCDELKKDKGNEKGMANILELNQIEMDYLQKEIEKISYQLSDDSLSKKRFENERIEIMAKNLRFKFLRKKGAAEQEHHLVITSENDMKSLAVRIENAKTEVSTIHMHANLVVAQIQKQISQLQSLNIAVPPPPQSFAILKSAKKAQLENRICYS